MVTKFAGKVVNAVRCGELHTLAEVPATSFDGVESFQIFDMACGSNFSIISFRGRPVICLLIMSHS